MANGPSECTYEWAGREDGRHDKIIRQPIQKLLRKQLGLVCGEVTVQLSPACDERWSFSVLFALWGQTKVCFIG